MNVPAGRDQFELETLKRLLLAPETGRLESVEAQVKALDARVGAPERLEKATAEILIEAFRAAEIARHRELANAVAPVVVAAIRSEIKNSRDMMVEALYPITGRLVAAAVANAFRDLVADLNERIERTLSTHHWRLRARALLSGRSLSEVALAEAQAPRLRRLLLLERGSGRPIAVWRADGEADETSELVSGLIAAITEFAASVYGAHGGELRTLDLGETRVFLRATPSYLIAADCAGALKPEHERDFDDAVLSLVGRLDRGEVAPDDGLADVAATVFLEKAPGREGSKWKLAAVAAVLAALVAWAASGPVLRAAKERRIETAFAEAVAARPSLAAFPLRVTVDHGAGVVSVVGVAPSQAQADGLARAIAPAAAPLAVRQTTAVVATAEEVAEQREALVARERRDAAAFDRASSALDAKAARADVEAALGELRNALAAAQARIAGLESARKTAESAQAEMAARLPDARDAAEKTLARTAIFFARDDQFADAGKARARAGEIAAALAGSDLRVRVIGHADTSGGRAQNIQLARARALAAVELLVQAGVDRARLHPVARADLQPIGDAVGADPRNRRATFEPVYDDEAAP